MPASVRSEVTTAIGSNATTHTYSFPATILSGDTIICALSMDDDNNAVTWPTGWTELWEVTNVAGSNDMTGAGAWYEADGTEDGGTFDVTSASGEKSFCNTWALQDADDPTTNPPEVGSASQAGTATPDPPIVTPGGRL